MTPQRFLLRRLVQYNRCYTAYSGNSDNWPADLSDLYWLVLQAFHEVDRVNPNLAACRALFRFENYITVGPGWTVEPGRTP